MRVTERSIGDVGGGVLYAQLTDDDVLEFAAIRIDHKGFGGAGGLTVVNPDRS